ncbi:polysaccharide biosynthesis protein [Listeria sp. PSOL-1]|uniref:putative polysaccharide biosynthesis protein n=1 Tax=Listeria sp. PSOL-1 TaxID=1844999 RepID=UPI0013CF6550|nr:polysaccharide biosynthesis protein [Listeria sp. PSOL-1]
MSERSIKNLMKGAMWLTIASLVSKILSAVYRVPFQNMVGDVGFYIFQQVYPIYGIAMTLALGGFPVVISKMMAEADGDIRRQQIILQSIYRVLKVIAFTTFLCLFLGAGVIANLMGDPHLASLIAVVSFVFLLSPKLSFFRGYFQGQEMMIPTAISQTIEQFIRIVIILAGSGCALMLGFDLYTASSFSMSGALFGGLIAYFILSFFYKRNLCSGGFSIWGVFAAKEEKKGIGREFLKQSIAVCLVSAMLTIFQLVDSFQVYRLMTEHGVSELLAKSIKGVYDRGQPILQLGLVISTGLSLALVPMITSVRVRHKELQLKRSVLLAMKLTIVVAGAETVGLIAIMRPLNQMLFETSDGTIVLQCFMPAVFLSSLIIMMSSILQGFGKSNLPAFAVMIGIVCKWIMNSLLVPKWLTLGAALSTCIGLIVILLCCYIALKRNLNVPFIEKRTLGYLGVVLIIMVFIPCLWEWLFPLVSRLGSMFQTLVSVALGSSLFLVFALRYRLFNTKDFVFLPFGTRLLALSRIVSRRMK